ncbi:lipopolysaccharide-binding protein-like [Saccostrea echinata]|uniref:lipopolysaccharide-binding protein-like n=1 Tax=Saccostrea echinata TaxID=191078 RepID=UPI002A841995|nr:lipopolysaccharide-binding protein-like [Saccostrea echinata]
MLFILFCINCDKEWKIHPCIWLLNMVPPAHDLRMFSAGLPYNCCILYHIFAFPSIAKITVASIKCNTPGLQTRITDKALNYATDVALDILSKQVTGLEIPDQHGSSGDVSYDITGLKINAFSKPSSRVSLIQKVGVAWSTSGGSLNVHGKFHYKYHGIFPISDSGSFDLRASGINAAINIELGSDTTGHPTMKSVGCSCSVGSADISFHGGTAWIYNLFSGIVADKLKDIVGGSNGILCQQLNNLVNVNGMESLKKLPVTVEIAKLFLLDYRFLSKPSFQSTFMETYHKGEVFWKSNPNEAPFPVPPLLRFSNTSRMMYLWVSDFLFNSMSYNAYKYNQLQYNVTNKDLPGGVLNTTCQKITCIGNFIPEIGKRFPNTTVMLYMKSTTMPNMTVRNGSTMVESSGDILFFAQQQGGKYTHFLTLSAMMSSTISVRIQNEKIYAKVLKLPIAVKVKDSKIGQLSPQVLDLIIKGVVAVFVEPKLNDFGSKGFPLPVIESVHFVDTQVTIAKDTLLIATDLKYSG